MTTLAAAIEQGQYELAVLRLLVGVASTLERLEADAPQARDELVSLLTLPDTRTDPGGAR